MKESLVITGQITLTGILIVLVTVWLNHVLSNTRDARNKRLAQGRKVVDTFQLELDQLIHSAEDAGSIMTMEAYLRHESTIRDYKTYLSWFHKYKVINAWRQLVYHPEDKKEQLPFYVQYADNGSLTAGRRLRPLVIHRMQTLIDLAKL